MKFNIFLSSACVFLTKFSYPTTSTGYLFVLTQSLTSLFHLVDIFLTEFPQPVLFAKMTEYRLALQLAKYLASYTAIVTIALCGLNFLAWVLSDLSLAWV